MTIRTLLKTTTCNTKGEAGGVRHQEELGALHEEGDEPAHGNKGDSLRDYCIRQAVKRSRRQPG